MQKIMLIDRYHRFDEKEAQDYEHSSPMNIILGLFMLWWGWLGFNCGSTFGVSGGNDSFGTDKCELIITVFCQTFYHWR